MADSAAIEQFKKITGADSDTAAFFLSAANGDCDAALSTYFESDGIIPTASEAPHLPRPSASTSTPVSVPSKVPATPPVPPVPHGGRPSSSTPANVAHSAPRPSSRPRSNQRFATLGSLERERDDDEKGYYAGGERSGQMIQDPRNRNDNRDAANTSNDENDTTGDPSTGLVNAILNRARSRGPRPDAEREHFEGPQRFAGAGYRLGDTEGRIQEPTIIGRRNVTRVLTFYANGFRVDEGPLRAFDDPANEAFLADVNRGVVPREMEEADVGDVSITLIDKKAEDYVEEPRPIVPFSGGGQRLDGSAQASSNNQPFPAQPSASQQPVDPAAAESVLTVDESRPTTRVQVRLTDGTRLVARLNADHTVGQLREFVRASRPSINQFTLATTFPKTVLNDDSKTIKDAGLMGAVVVQSLS